VLTSIPLEDDVLERDPRIPRSVEIALSDDRGTVTLRGTVERFSQRRAAAERAAKVDGVYEAINHLKVNVPGADSRSDHEIRGAALDVSRLYGVYGVTNEIVVKNL
jgi:osmotically-inducible protein OsmY